MARGLAETYESVERTQQVVCFTETPLEHAWMMCEEIDGRSVNISGYGLAFTKTFARRNGANPVWYIDQTPGHDWLTQPIDRLVKGLENDPDSLPDAEILQLTPFFEQMGPTSMGGHKEFWWEREWRHVGNMRFKPEDVVVIFAPERWHDSILNALAGYRRWAEDDICIVDATWGLERMIGSLAGIADAGPFPE